MNINTNSTLSDIVKLGTGATGYKPAELPEVAYFRVQSRGACGTYKNGLRDRKCGAWAVLVSCKDGKGLRLATDVAYENGMKLKGEFATREEAIEAGKKFLAAWGKEAEKKERKAKEPTKAEIAKQLADALAVIASLKGGEKTEGEKQEELKRMAM